MQRKPRVMLAQRSYLRRKCSSVAKTRFRSCLLTLNENLWDFGMAGAESAVDFKTICIVEERASQGEEHFL